MFASLPLLGLPVLIYNLFVFTAVGHPPDLAEAHMSRILVTVDMANNGKWVVHTGDLFEGKKEETRSRLLGAVDTLNQTFGKNSVYFGGAHGATAYAPIRIAFTRIPDPEVEEIDAQRGRRLRPKKTTPPPAEAEE